MAAKKHLSIVVDIEASGPVPGLYDMISVGMVVMSSGLKQTFYGEFAPLYDVYSDGAYASIGMTRKQHLAMPPAAQTMTKWKQWVDDLDADRLTMISDNPSFDCPFVNWYWHLHYGVSPFGHSGRRIGDFYAGLKRDFKATSQWKKLRKTKHSHNALDDAMGNAEALNAIFTQQGLSHPW